MGVLVELAVCVPEVVIVFETVAALVGGCVPVADAVDEVELVIVLEDE